MSNNEQYYRVRTSDGLNWAVGLVDNFGLTSDQGGGTMWTLEEAQLVMRRLYDVYEHRKAWPVIVAVG